MPVIGLSQLSREVENREEKRPLLADLRDSGCIEEDADVVIFLYRDEYYLERKRPIDPTTTEYAGWMAKMAPVSGKAEVIVAKNRHGAIGVALLQFDASITRFSDLAHSDQASRVDAHAHVRTNGTPGPAQQGTHQ